ncbi:DUF262 domain-containing protein [Amycolatopsis sp. NBC_01307]|uniref:DUF262 domain-containing protein n=1 Tax=Amycolatopsis sp. NBC_01307 TaxID=2903561 RepID=UPI002E0DD1A2|nr:DUF262 domain-containing protein [Amycolatopsis sp. NBC_01307]
MKLEPWEPDLRTLIARQEEGELDLQPDFQRGLAWNTVKQQRLIDTILRQWSIPPLHILVLPDEKLAVLDGQQRLRAIKKFIAGNLKVGSFDPFDDFVRSLKGLTFDELPDTVKRRIHNYKISCYRLYEYKPDEPYELFFRLNLPTGLTQAEKRNALIGDSRKQIKDLVALAKSAGWRMETIGFENARLAYDDTIARACAYVESRSLRTSLNASELEAQYRKDGGFSSATINVVAASISGIGRAVDGPRDGFRLNKATLLTWILILCRAELNSSLRQVDLGRLLVLVERGRVSVRRPSLIFDDSLAGPRAVVEAYLELYNDRASLRVTDVLSVIARDAVAWRLAAFFDDRVLQNDQINNLVGKLGKIESNPPEIERETLHILESPQIWGDLA